MNCTLLTGSPRKNGNTAILLQHIIKGIQAAQGQITLFRLANMDIHPCIGCGSCEKTGECIFKDSMEAIYQSLATADRILLCSPIYFYNFTAQTKICIDRCQALWSRKYILKKPIGQGITRKGYLVSISATTGERIFEGTKLTARYALDAMNCSLDEEFLIHGVDKKGEIATHTATLEKAYTFGRKLCQP
jgi:multimeric flavodoxin WrbA